MHSANPSGREDTMRRTLTILTLAISALPLGLGIADEAPYLDEGTREIEEPSPTGTATAAATASKDTGALSVDAAATEDDLLPFALIDGRSRATAAAGIAHILPVETAGSYIVRATLTNTTATATESGTELDFISFGADVGVVEAVMAAILFDCSSGSCSNVFGSEGFKASTLACSSGCDAQSGTIELDIAIDVPEGVTGEIFVGLDLSADAIARGQGSASASASATLTSIDLIPAPSE